ncbi:hypothetical protein [Streptomyces clavuligerus]|nr:hypothetical protein [Streptomyces clavuligerus]
MTKRREAVPPPMAPDPGVPLPPMVAMDTGGPLGPVTSMAPLTPMDPGVPVPPTSPYATAPGPYAAATAPYAAAGPLPQPVPGSPIARKPVPLQQAPLVGRQGLR